MIEKLLNRLLKCRVIVNCDHDPFMYRWYVLRTKWVSVFIHKFVRDDEDRALHDHPWAFLVIPIWRGYVEHCERKRIPHARRVRPLLGMRLRRATYRHRVVLIGGKPAWSVFIHFRRWREWGFWPREGFTPWNKWWQEKCE
jgi:hypothetical protein